ncbi:MAG: stress response translation initiation inhibitor YciH [Pseudomonadales bacterium]|nr:stress response translation initiation inhibitor YciH [Pseudomonadales bacterium]
MNNKDSRTVYSTDSGRITYRDKPEKKPPAMDGIVRLRLETKGRKGKGVTTVSGLSADENELKATCRQLKQICSCGGSVKDYVIEIQGDHRQAIKAALEKNGYTVKLAGG